MCVLGEVLFLTSKTWCLLHVVSFLVKSEFVRLLGLFVLFSK